MKYKYLITFMDGEKEEVTASGASVYADDKERIGRISFYDDKGHLTACYAGDCVLSYKWLGAEE